MASQRPFVRVVILAFDGAAMTVECIESVLTSGWPRDRQEIVLVDNGSLDDVVEQVRDRFPEVRILEPIRNLGFAGGCNLGMTAERCSQGQLLQPFDHIALVNNDATVGPGWLDPLVQELDRNPRIGAACPKILFHHRYREIEVSALFPDPGVELIDGVRLTAVRIDGERHDSRMQLDEGFSYPNPVEDPDHEDFVRWTMHGGRIRIAVDPTDAGQSLSVRLRIGARCAGWVRLRIGDDERDVRVGFGDHVDASGNTWVECELPGPDFDVINNAGSELYNGGSAGDRGVFERDRGQYDESREVFAWCGGAVLLRKEYLDSVGLFDEEFFLYYEDTDLAWRGQLAGWTYVYSPDSVVRHRHAQSTQAGSEVFSFHVARNRLLILAKNATLRVALRGGFGEIQRFVHTCRTDLIAPALRLHLPRRARVFAQFRVLSSYFSLLPHVLRQRWMMDVRVRRRRVMSWAVDKIVPVPVFDAPVALQSTKSPETARSTRPTAAVYNLHWQTFGGGEVVAGEIARVLLKDHDVTLLGPTPPDVDKFRERLGIDVSQCQWRMVMSDDEASAASADFDVFVNGTYLSSAVNRAPLGIFFVHFPIQGMEPVRRITLTTLKKFTDLARKFKPSSQRLRTMDRLIIDRVGETSWTPSYSVFLANSTYTQHWIDKVWGRPSEIIHPPVGEVVEPAEKSPSIVSIGRFFDPSFGHSKKQMEMMIAFADMARSRDGVGDWRLTLIGGADGASRDFVLRLRRAAQSLPVDIHVNAPREIVDSSLAHASVYWHASGYDEDPNRHPERFEHFGIAVVEAMAAGAVPIVYGAAGPAEIVRHGIDGFHWRTLEELAHLTRRLMSDPDLLSSMSLKARERSGDFSRAAFEQSFSGILGKYSPAQMR